MNKLMIIMLSLLLVSCTTIHVQTTTKELLALEKKLQLIQELKPIVNRIIDTKSKSIFFPLFNKSDSVEPYILNYIHSILCQEITSSNIIVNVLENDQKNDVNVAGIMDNHSEKFYKVTVTIKKNDSLIEELETLLPKKLLQR